MYPHLFIEGPLGRATPAALLFLIGKAVQGGEIKHAIQSRRFQQDDMDSMEPMDSLDPE